MPDAPACARALAALAARWEAAAPRSRALFDRAVRVLPSGVSHDMRRRSVFSPYYLESAGAYKTDLDGRRYLDLWMGHGSLLLGHGHPAVVEAMCEQIPKGTHLGGSHPAEVELAEAVVRLVPGVEKLRFVMSGTEATLLAIRLARAATERPVIVKFEEHFHGWHDAMSAGRCKPYGTPLGGGLPAGVRSDVRVCPPRLEAVEEALSGGDVAAVILEPTGAHGGAVPFPPGFVQELRRMTRKRESLLLFDEVVTGFRIAPGGAQEVLGVEADLVAFAKVLFGGVPGGAVAGRADLLDLLAFSGEADRDRYRKVHHNGTHNANPMSARAGVRVLEAVATGEPNRLAAEGARRLVAAGNAVIEEHALPWVLFDDRSILHLVCHLAPGEIAAGRREGWHAVASAIAGGATPVRTLLDAALLLHGVDLPTGSQAWTSLRHGEAEAACFAEALDRSIRLLKELEVLP